MYYGIINTPETQCGNRSFLLEMPAYDTFDLRNLNLFLCHDSFRQSLFC